jgi:hypothetical protein
MNTESMTFKFVNLKKTKSPVSNTTTAGTVT